MAGKVDKLAEVYQSNAYPAMLDNLSEHLGVSSESLSRLDLGWAPIVEFKNGPNFQGWWAIPERDADGKPLGLSLRSRSDMKVMLPGSKHGLTYELNPAHERGRTMYKHGPQNWVRTMDTGNDCPVCGKPDGCLVSSENVEEPKAVVCIRVRDGSDRPMRFGYLHILKPEGRVAPGVSSLPDSPHPVVVVEGMTDTAAAMDLGFVAVGRPSNLACMDMLADLVRGRDVVVVGENDDINQHTGQRPGQEGMVATFQVLKKACPNIRMVLPPEHVKDLRQWVNKFSLTASQFLGYVDENGKERSELTVLPDSKPSTMAKAWLDADHRMAGRYTLRYYKDQWFTYAGSKYREADEKTDIRGPLYRWSEDKMVLVEGLKGDQSLQPVICTRGMVGNVLDALLDPCPVNVPSVPAWINDAGGPDPDDLIAFNNGLLWVSRYLAGADESEYLLDPTPDYFTTFSLPFTFDSTAKHPAWDDYLESTLGHDPERVRLLQEWFGYCLTPDTSKHKMLLLRGPRRSGKGTALHMLQAIVGNEQAADVSFSKLTKEFGLEDLVGKQIALMNEAILPRHGDGNMALEVLLKIVGEDPVNIARKFKSALPAHRLKTRITMTANELPDLPDNSGALESRLNIIDFSKSFYGREDFGLKDRLKAEAPGVVLWALEGLRRLRKQDRFTLPAASRDSLREWRVSTSPTAAFIEECCDQATPGQEIEVQKKELYDCWTGWSRERGMRPVAKSKFFERVKANAPFAVSRTYEKGGLKFSVYQGIRLKRWAAKQFTGQPN